MPQLSAVTGLGRGFDSQLRSNRIALAGTALATATYAGLTFVTDARLLDAPIAGIVVFLGWATGRELDPDRPQVAAWSMLLTFAASIYILPSGVAAAAALVAIRLVAGTVGARVTWLDVAIFSLLGYASGSTTVLWIVAITLVMWLVTGPEAGRLRYVGLASFVAGIVAGAVLSELATADITQNAYILAAVGGAVMMAAMRPRAVVSPVDSGSGHVDPLRVGFARKTAGSFLMWAALMGGVAGFWSISPVLGALVATAFAKWFSPGA